MQHIFDKPPPGTQINLTHPLAKGIVGCWLMNDGGWRCYDLSPYKNHGTLSGFDSPPKRSSLGVAFDGIDNFISLSNIQNITLTGTYSISGWFKVDEIVANKTMFCQTIAAGDRMGITIASVLKAGHYDGAAYQGAKSSSTLIAGTWYHFAYIYVNQTSSLYINGTPQTDVTAPTTNTVVGTRIGTTTTGASPFRGTVSEIRVYNRALSVDEVRELYINPYGMFERD